ncbi:MAG: Fur family transcriptional regulator [Spirochaetia bacterium]|jgi:Fur family ferric uptake transcriptional regulator|nr:Fur family transcriptional regulator [Spirochaetales bacterium]MDX9783140.1 Fur family transcriptional regulator [Spirochaetia bacterium]
MKEEQFRFIHYLKSKGLKLTSARKTVLTAFLRSEGHLSAEDLLAAAKKIDPGLGQATVFRTLKLLADAGLAQDACQDEGPRRYEHVYKHAHHDHLLCIGCGKLIEFCHPEIEKAQTEIFKEFGFQATGHRLELRGLCADCAGKSGKAND